MGGAAGLALLSAGAAFGGDLESSTVPRRSDASAIAAKPEVGREAAASVDSDDVVAGEVRKTPWYEIAPPDEALSQAERGSSVSRVSYWLQPASPSFQPEGRLGSARLGERSALTMTEQDLGALVESDTRTAAAQLATTVAPDLGSALRQVNDSANLGLVRRSAVALDPYIRGYRGGQIYTTSDGTFWSPARPDLDSMLSKIDPSLVKDVKVVSGPFGVEYGPGFSFFDVQMVPTPRSQDGRETHYTTGLNFQANGGQVYGRETITSGTADSGFLINYGNRTGSDYRAGNGAPISDIPSSYHNQSFYGVFSWDLSDETTVDFRYQRLDQSNTEFAVQFFDIASLATDNFGLTLRTDDEANSRYDRVDAWYNRTWFNGNTNNVSKRSFHVIDRVEGALGNYFGVSPADTSFAGYTNGDYVSTGGRVGRTLGDAGEMQLQFGADARYLEQHIGETFTAFDTLNNVQLLDVATNLPRANMVDAGIYGQWIVPLTSNWKTSVGGRIDWVTSTASRSAFPGGLRSDTSLADDPLNVPLDQNDLLGAANWKNELQLSDVFTTEVRVGYAQRPPTLVERYSDGVFLGLLQNGFTRVIGDPNLAKESLYQADATLKADGELGRGRASMFFSWIDDPVTYVGLEVQDVTGARLLRYANGNLVTMWGFELSGDRQILDHLSTYGAWRYTEGREHDIRVGPDSFSAPWYGITPMEGRVGLRVHDENRGERWALDFGVRMVKAQNQLGLLRLGTNMNDVSGVIPAELSTPGFAIGYLRGYYDVSKNLHLIGGVENLFDRAYFEHLDLRLPNQGSYTGTTTYSPGVTPYLGVVWTL